MNAIQTLIDLEDGEKVVAVIFTFQDGTIIQHCHDCLFTEGDVTDERIRELLAVCYHTSQEFTSVQVLTEMYDSVWSNNAHLFLGERCDSCHSRLGGWVECQCGWMGWGDDCHECTLMESDPELWEDVMSGFETGYVED